MLPVECNVELSPTYRIFFSLAAVSSSVSTVAVRAKCAGGLGELDFHYQGSGGNIKGELSVSDVKEVIIWFLLNVPVTSKEGIEVSRIILRLSCPESTLQCQRQQLEVCGQVCWSNLQSTIASSLRCHGFPDLPS